MFMHYPYVLVLLNWLTAGKSYLLPIEFINIKIKPDIPFGTFNKRKIGTELKCCNFLRGQQKSFTHGGNVQLKKN